MANEKQTKWAVWFPKEGRYVSSARGGNAVAWTHDRAVAEQTASAFGGEVIDAEILAKEWPTLASNGSRAEVA